MRLRAVDDLLLLIRVCIRIYDYTSKVRLTIYINTRCLGKYANLKFDATIFFPRQRLRRVADVFAQEPVKIIRLSLSENGKLRTSFSGRDISVDKAAT